MASMDFAREDFSIRGDDYYLAIKNEIESFGGKISEFEILPSDDISRLVLYKEGFDCYDLMLQLNDIGYNVEMAYEDKLVLIVTPFNYMKLRNFEKALNRCEFKLLKYKKIKDINVHRDKLIRADK